MMENDAIHDIILIKEMLNISDNKLATDLGVSRSTLNRWLNKEVTLTDKQLKTIYEYIYKIKIDINSIKAQFFIEDYSDNNHIVLFHGSKNGIENTVDLNHSKRNNDLGAGFYLGETFEQAAMFTASYSKASIYIFQLDKTKLKSCRFNVDQEWMLAIAYYRGRLNEYKDSPTIKNIIKKVEKADYIIAPIADNKMYSIISNFIDGEITDEQCKHCLSATDLGFQYIIKTEKAIKNLVLLSNCYITENEKMDYLKSRENSIRSGNDKVKAARIKYAGKGKYINELLNEEEF